MTPTPALRLVPWLLCVLAGCVDGGGDSAATQGPASTSTGTSTTGSEPTTTGTLSGTPTTSTGEPTSSTGTTSANTSGTSGSDSEGTSTGADTDGIVDPVESPWGIASSHSSSQILDVWAAPIAATGVTWLRGIDNSQPEARLDTAEANGWQVAGILYYSTQSPGTFPVDDLPGWQDFITTLLGKTLGRMYHWEVWNEPPNFTENKSPEAYATIVQAAYEAVKAVDPAVQVGLAAQSNHVHWLEQTILAGAAGHFDYVTVHPYEILDLVEDGWEAEYMSIVPTLRKMLAARDPDNADAPVWFTEIGQPVTADITAEQQADTLVKAYTMAIAQGVTRVHWFEGRDGDSGPFGLLTGDDQQRLSYTAMTTLVARLGSIPRYRGWLVPGGEYHGFVFAGDDGPVMVAWARPGLTVELTFPAPLQIVDPRTGEASEGTAFTLTGAPTLFVGVADDVLAEAIANREKPFPWGGDFTDAPSIAYSAEGGDSGLHPLGAGKLVTIDGVPARDVGDRPAQSFTVDPNFLSYDTVPIRVEAVLRRNGAQSAGFNLKYEAASGYKSTGGWYTIPEGDAWVTATWDIDDPQFVGKWGYNFAFDSDSTQHSQYSIRSVTVTKL
ncbi:glycosyl hydrolase [Nannocystis punicea]|uniref:Glycosyl hydrolase n=1 Tax=Nannocystis punicea TaxID=2995304 RepID=A0ABY7GV13_9BACT|nr:glycosyl hydrolase [Nannocystis poenicansa]WAS90760.1 glycosyl hydrolase [Nannocystis poenicansa]